MKWIAQAAALLAVASSSSFAQDVVDFWAVEQRAVQRLDTVDATALAESIASAPKTTDAAELLFRFEACARAGHDEAAVAALDRLREAVPPLQPHVAANLVDSLIDRKQRALAIAAFERFPEATAGWGCVLLREWAAADGWEIADRWAAQRQPAAPDYWLAERLRLRAEIGKAQELFDELVLDAKSHPADVERFLCIVRVARNVSPQPDSGWIATAFSPRLAFDAALLGQELSGRPAVAVLERALAMPMGEEDVAAVREYVRHNMARVFSDDPDELGAWLRRSIQDALLRAYQEAGDAAQAQALLVALADERPEVDGLPGVSLFLAGRVQAESGARVIEGRVRAAEEVERDSPKYWEERAEYYRGRGEIREALDALDRALALTPFETNAAEHCSLIVDRARLLPRPEGAAYLRRELARMPADSEHAARTLAQLVYDWPEVITADDPLAWRHLAALSEWSYTEEKLLRLLAERATPDHLEPFWTHAEELARAGPAARVVTLGEVASQREDSARAAALIAPAMAQMPEGELRDRAALTLFEASRELRDWKRAESIWPLARLRLMPREQVRWLGALALAQAEAGASDEAMRTWSRASNLDRRELWHLQSLAEAGLRERLVAFYTEIAKRDPAAAPFVARVLEGLEAR